MIKELSRLYTLFIEINITQIEASVTLFAFFVLVSPFLEKDRFPIKMDLCVYFSSSKGLAKTLTLKTSLKRTFTSSYPKENL